MHEWPRLWPMANSVMSGAGARVHKILIFDLNWHEKVVEVEEYEQEEEEEEEAVSSLDSRTFITCWQCAT